MKSDTSKKKTKAPAGEKAGVAVSEEIIKDNQYYKDLICESTRNSRLGMKRIVEELQKIEPDIPNASTITRWKIADEDFCTQYARAKEDQVEVLVEEMIEIADDDSLDIGFRGDGTTFIDHEHIQRSKLRIDTRKWIASKLKSKKYGDKLAVGGDSDNPITHTITVLSREDLAL